MNDSNLRVEHVTRRFGSGATEVVAVRDVSLSVAPGEVVLIMGPSGSGKTTLLSMLGALLKPTEGEIQLNGAVLSALSEHRLPTVRLRHFGFIFQDFNLLSALTVLENVAIVAELAGAKKGGARRRAATLLGELGLAERLNFLPEKLSGGEKQRVAIARALINDPALILADEPTANLDSSIGHEVMRLLRHIAKAQGRSVIIVSHDARIKDIADRVLWLEDGQFKDMVSMATDPVCGMAVEREKAVSAEREGRTFYFCSRGCRNEFLEDPEQFREAADRPVAEHDRGAGEDGLLAGDLSPARQEVSGASLLLTGVVLAYLARRIEAAESPHLISAAASLVPAAEGSPEERAWLAARKVLRPLAAQILLAATEQREGRNQ